MIIENIEQFLDLFAGRRQNSPTDWHVPCPAHDDNIHDPTKFSLHVTLVDGKIVIKCFAGCDSERVLHLKGLTWPDLFLRSRAPREEAAMPEPTPTLAAFAQLKNIRQSVLDDAGWRNVDDGLAIPYLNRDGSLYRMRHRTSLRPGAGFRWDGQKDRPLIPYGRHRLDQVMEKGELWLVEGESDSVTAWGRGLPCLGIPGNLAVKCLTAEDLVGIETLWILREPGQSGDGFVAKAREHLPALGYTGAARVVTLPAKDLSDLHVLRGREFWPAVRAAQDEAVDLFMLATAADPPAEEPPLTKVLRGAAISMIAVTEVDWMIDRVFSTARQHMGTGASQSAKTWLVYDVAIAVAEPEITTVLGQRVCRHGRVCIESWEMGQAEDVRRVRKLLRGHGLATAGDGLILLSDTRPTLSDESYFTRRRRELREWDCRLYVVDSLSEAAGIELNDNTAYTAWWRARVKPLLDDGVTVLWTHLRGHAKPGVAQDRDSASRGATQIRALSTGVLDIRQVTDTLFTLRHNKHRDGLALPFGALTLEGSVDEPSVRLVVRDEAAGLLGKQALARRLLTALGQAQAATPGAKPLTRRAIEDALNGSSRPKDERVSKKTYEPALADMVDEGLFHASKAGNADAWDWTGPAGEGEEDDADLL